MLPDAAGKMIFKMVINKMSEVKNGKRWKACREDEKSAKWDMV